MGVGGEEEAVEAEEELGGGECECFSAGRECRCRGVIGVERGLCLGMILELLVNGDGKGMYTGGWSKNIQIA